MIPLASLAELMSWAGKNTAHNLAMLPADRLDWKPEPKAKSALEIVNHVCWFITAMTPVIRGAAWADPEFTPATDGASAQALVRSVSSDYSDALKSVAASALVNEIQLPWGAFPLARAASMPVVDLIHHHGQIVYLQTLLGDEEMHFVDDTAS